MSNGKYRFVTLFILDGARAMGLMTQEDVDKLVQQYKEWKFDGGKDEVVKLGARTPVIDEKKIILPNSAKERAVHYLPLSSIVMIREGEVPKDTDETKWSSLIPV